MKRNEGNSPWNLVLQTLIRAKTGERFHSDCQASELQLTGVHELTICILTVDGTYLVHSKAETGDYSTFIAYSAS